MVAAGSGGAASEPATLSDRILDPLCTEAPGSESETHPRSHRC